MRMKEKERSVERKNLLEAEDRERIIRCVREVEQRTAGEIVPMIVPASYHYTAARMTGSFAYALIVAILGTAAFTAMRMWGDLSVYDMWIFPGVLALGFLIAYPLLGAFPSLRKPFIPRAEMEEEVREAAHTAFWEHGLYLTRNRTGILIFVSLYERKVHVLADSGIDEKVDASAWKEIVAIIVDGMRNGNPTDAICRAVGRCGDFLAEQVPGGAGNRDELRNLIAEDGEDRDLPR